ncbi:septation protein IspZ [Telmatospirillum siberiense]|uniref:Inner membrane-spanning protein YciB n=1 Tax=Telmatospirillum siberiense TaxID=382514 RepID=A0A2N3PXG0_9PROT|nr:septation protein IspZ [Telmatospirillum siberiense]PKU25061.1 septation protein IspZ [Telmatospirillum siberiense]
MSKAPPPAWLKPLVDYLPLVVFLAAFEFKGLMVATVALMATTLVALILSLAVARRVPLVPLLTAVIVGVFGGLTLWFNDETFIKIKPTIIYGLFAAILGGGLFFGRTFLKAVMGEALPLDELGWRRLTLRFTLFFVAMALANEVIRRVVTTEMWVLWKVPGSMILTFLFILTQMGLIKRHRLPDHGAD